MSIFRKRPSNDSSRSPISGSGADSLHTREALTAPHPNARSAGIPRPDRRMPAEAIGISRLLETYDEYHHLTQVVASTEAELGAERERAEVAEDARAALEQDLRREKEGRTADGVKAEKDKKTAETEREKKIRGDLEPKIKDLQEKLKKMTTERDGLKKEVNDKNLGMSRWVTAMEKLGKERALAEGREKVAAEDRRKLDEKLKVLDGEILSGMKGWQKTAEERAAALKKLEDEAAAAAAAESKEEKAA